MKHFKYLFSLALLLLAAGSSKTLAQGTEHAPAFTGGHGQFLTVCENTASASVDALLVVIDSDSGDMETWSVVTAPSSGSVAASYTTVSTGSVLVPSGLTYTPATGFSGADSFTVSVSDGMEADTTTIFITVSPLPSAGTIMGIDGACAADTTTLSDAAAGGAWSSTNTAIATIDSVSGTVSGLSAGTTTISYLVTNSCGTAVTTLLFTVSAAPLPVPASITGLHSACTGSSISLHDATLGGEWISSNPAVATIDPVTGMVTGVSAGIAAISYAEVNFCASYYSTISVTVNAVPSAITGSPHLCTNASVALGDPITGGTWTSSASSVASIELTTGIVTGIAPGTAVITYTAGVAGCSITGTVTVNITPSAFTVTGGGGYCTGGTGADIGLSGSAPGISYQLYMGGTPAGGPMAGAGAPLDFGLHTGAGTYVIEATDTLTGCTKNMTGSVTITLIPLPLLYSVAGGGSYCAGSVTGYHIFLVGSQSGISYDLYNAGVATGASITGTGAGIDYGLLTAPGTYTVIATNPLTGCTRTMTGSAIIADNPNPAVFAIIGGGNFCAGGAGVHIGLDSSAIGIRYQVYNGASPFGSPVPGTGIPMDFGLTAAGGIYTVVATNPATTCASDMTGSATIIVNPLPTPYTVTGGGGYCIGGSGRHISLAGSDSSNISYQLYYGAVATGAAHTGTDSAIDFGAEAAAGIYTIVATNTTTTCTSDMAGGAVITIDSLPALYTVSGGGSYCAGGYGVYISLSGSVTGTDYLLYNGTTSATFPETGTGGPLDLGLETSDGTYTVVATNTVTGCTSNMTGSATVTENPLPAAITGIDSIITGASVTLSDATPGGTWSSGNLSIATVGAPGIIYGDTVGTDSVFYTLPTGCRAAVVVTVNYAPIDTSTASAVQALNYAGTIAVFPNPAIGDDLSIKWEGQATGNAGIIITDVAGREVYKAAINLSTLQGQAQINPDLKSGIYIIAIKSETTFYTCKIQVLR